MTLAESTTLLRQLDPGELEELTYAATERARAIAEFAALAPLQELEDARDAGQRCIARLQNFRQEILSELMHARKLHGALVVNSDCRTLVEPTFFLG